MSPANQRQQTPLYPMAKLIQHVCDALALSSGRVLRRAGLPVDYHMHETKGLTAAEVFAFWDAVFDEANDPGLSLYMGREAAHGQLTPACYAYKCSPSVRQGLQRMSMFKRLVGPYRLSLVDEVDGLRVRVLSSEPAHQIPPRLQLAEAVFFIELIRISTDVHVVPLSVKWTGETSDKMIEEHMGVALQPDKALSFTLSRQDAARPLLSEDSGRWHLVERDLFLDLEAVTGDRKTTSRLRSVLLEMLPSGDASIEGAAKRLHMTSRTLQRRLRDEQQNFSAILDNVRHSLAMSYLKVEDLSVNEIAHLLAYRDPNSFYRAFAGWTGKTPKAVRAQNGR